MFAASGCLSQLSQVKADNTRLRKTVTKLRADQRSSERTIRKLENELALAKDRVETAAIDRGRTGAPVLPVEVLAPEQPRVADPATSDLGPDARVVDVTEDGTAIVYAGEAASGRAGRIEDDDLGRGPAPSRPSPRARRREPDRAPSAHDAAAADAYRAAVELVRAGKHDEAIAKLRDFLRAHPGHDYADNAQYWLGEAYYDRKDYQRALAEFRVAVDKYPRGNKVPDAMLKVAYCYLALGQLDKARFVLEQVVTIYPDTEPALLASRRLDTIKK